MIDCGLQAAGAVEVITVLAAASSFGFSNSPVGFHLLMMLSVQKLN